jgi:hypothetical protein
MVTCPNVVSATFVARPVMGSIWYKKDGEVSVKTGSEFGSAGG